MEKKNLKYFAAICFAILAVLALISVFNNFSFLNLIQVVAYVVIVVALLIDKPALSTIGFAVFTILSLYDLVSVFEPLVEGYLPFYFLLRIVMLLAVNILLVIASITPKSAKSLGLVAAIIAFIRLILIVIQFISNGYDIAATTILWGLALAGGAMLLGLTYDSLPKKTVSTLTVTAQASNNPIQGTLEESNIEKIMRLKSFLDEGVITQEEFDAKKKQLLGL